MRILYLPSVYAQQRQYEKKGNIYPVLLAMEAEWYRKQKHEVNWGNPIGQYDKIISEPEGLPFLELPHPDRKFTRWWEWQNNGNFKYLPATYIQSARDCWWHKCTFCRWAKKYPNYECRSVSDVILELWECYHQGFKEVFDDSGTFNTQDRSWFFEFRNRLAQLYEHSGKRFRFSCNMRMEDENYKDMRLCGFRMILFGLESANQKTLDRINKGVKVEDIKYIIKASKYGLEPHTAAMVGYPWESDEDAFRTIKLVKWLLNRGYTKTAQISFYTPPLPQTQGNEKQRKFVNRIYDVAYNPLFWWNKLKDIKTVEDIRYLLRSIGEGINATCCRTNL